MSDIKGRYLWLDLITTDLEAARAFYQAVVGFKLVPHNPEYMMFAGANGPIGGSMLLSDAAKAMGAPPHWLAYIGTPDVDATAEQVKALGGTVYVPPFTMGDVGRISIVADPQGAVFGVYCPASASTTDHDVEPTGVGEMVWSELMTADYEAGWSFYQKVFGWTHAGSMESPAGPYHMFTAGKRHSMGGMMTKPAGMPVSAWGYYFHVANLTESIEAVKSMGGQVVHGPMQVPGGAHVVQCIDPQGAFFALHALGA